MHGHEAQVTTLDFSPSSRLLVSTSHRDKSARVWNVTNGKSLHVFSGSLPIARARVRVCV